MTDTRLRRFIDPDAPVEPYARAMVRIALVLMAVGVLMVYSASSARAGLELGDSALFLKRQLVWSFLGVAAIFATMRLDHRRLVARATPALVVVLVLLAAVLVAGPWVNGARRWLRVGALSFQPSEAAKLVLVAWLASHLSRNAHRLDDWRHGIAPAVVVLAAVVGLVLPEPDLGTAVFLLALGGAVLLVGGISVRRMAIMSLAFLPLVGWQVANRWEFVVRRFQVVAGVDEGGAAVHQVRQSLIALGSGGVFGQGLGAGRQKLLFLPEAPTDFILPVIGEEAGFVGTGLVLLLFVAFVLLGLRVALGIAQRERLGFLLVFGLVFHVGLQAAGNVAVVTGSVPTKGIALPFVSLGGSSLVMLCVAVGLVYSVAARLDAEWCVQRTRGPALGGAT